MTSRITKDLQLNIQENLDRNCAYRTINSEIETIEKLRDTLNSTFGLNIFTCL